MDCKAWSYIFHQRFPCIIISSLHWAQGDDLLWVWPRSRPNHLGVADTNSPGSPCSIPSYASALKHLALLVCDDALCCMYTSPHAGTAIGWH